MSYRKRRKSAGQRVVTTVVYDSDPLGSCFLVLRKGSLVRVERREVDRAIAGVARVTQWCVGGGWLIMPANMSPAEMIAAARRTKGPPTDGRVLESGGVLASCPFIRAFLQEPMPGQGESRSVGTLLLFWADDRWKLCLSDRAEGRAVWGQGDTLEEALDNIEGRLQNGTAEWRRDKPKGGRRP